MAGGITNLLVTFNQDVYNPAGDSDPKDVTNPANYLLVHDNRDGFQTTSCAMDVDPLDPPMAVNSVTYSNNSGAGSYVATLNINYGSPLANGGYRLFVCGTTFIVDLVDQTLALAGDGTNSGTDFVRNFRITIPGNGPDNDNGSRSGLNTSGLFLPSTGFDPNQTTLLPIQSEDNVYSSMGAMSIEIPSLGIKFPFVGAALSKGGWDLTWPMNNVCYLEGSTYPTHSGNSILSGHVLDSDKNLGPFSDIKGLYKVYIHAFGKIFV